MAYRLEVCFVHKRETFDPCTRIVAVGGITHDGSRWWIPQAIAIEGIERGRWAFYIRDRRTEIEIVIGRRADGVSFLCEIDDDAELQRLLALPSCASAKSAIA